MTVRTYDPKAISVIIGTAVIAAFADSDFVKVERNEASWMQKVGADGETTRTKSANRSGKITLTLLASSPSNDVLSALQLADDLSGAATFNVLIKDLRGTSLYSASTAWIEKPAGGTFGKEAGNREWVIETNELLMFAGGNS